MIVMLYFSLLCLILSNFYQICSSSVLMEAAEKLYPDSSTREKNLIASLQTLKNMRLDSISKKKSDKIEPTILCTTFVEPSFKHLAITEYNMKVSSQFCDWGILYIGDDDLNIIKAIEKTADVNNVTLQFVEQSLSPENVLKKFSSSPNQFEKVKEVLGSKFKLKGIPKAFLLMQIIQYARKYNYVWLLDADITFEAFDVEKYFEAIKSLPDSPLLLQPVISTNDRPHSRLNLNYYEKKLNADKIAPSNIIESMLPMIDSGFLVWFANFFMKPMLPIAYAVSGDFGSELIWCRASGLYLEIGLDVKDFKARTNSACVVIVHTPIKHLDWDDSPSITAKDDSLKLTAMYTHLLDGVKELRGRFLPTKNEKYGLTQATVINSESHSKKNHPHDNNKIKSMNAASDPAISESFDG